MLPDKNIKSKSIIMYQYIPSLQIYDASFQTDNYARGGLYYTFSV